MINIKHKIKIILLAACISAFFPINSARGTIASITTTPANPTLMSNGLSYYLAGYTYDFSVQVVDPDITGWAQVGIVQITIPCNTIPIVLSIIPSGTGNYPSATVSSGTVIASADIAPGDTWNNFTVIFHVIFRWDTEELLPPAVKTITGEATTTVPLSNTLTDTAISTYGVCTTMKILDFVASGIASDGMVNQNHDLFHITGRAVYNIPGAGPADSIGDMLSADILLNGVNTAPSLAALPGLDFTIPARTFNSSGFLPGGAQNIWRVRGTMSTAGGPESSFNSLPIRCDEVEITGMSFINGGGINIPAYYRSTDIPGTEVVLTARMRYSLSPMVGNTTITINNFTDGTTFTVFIPDGSTTGTTSVPWPTLAGLPVSPGTLQNFYRVESIIGGAYGGDDDLVDSINNITLLPPADGIPDNGQYVFTRITQPAAVSIYWDNGGYPWYTNTPFTTWSSVSATAYSFTLNWTGLVLSAPNQDFYSYRIYYKENTASVFQMIDKTTAGYASLGNCTTNTATITGLVPLTIYDYYISALDVFGNEVPTDHAIPYAFTYPIPDPYPSVGTLASTITVTLSDGITGYANSTFTANPLPPARPLRKTAIKIKTFIVAAGDLPDIVNILLANYTTGNFLLAGVLNLTENSPLGYYRITTLKTGANEWTGFIPETNPLITVGTDVKFIIETIKSGVPSYADNNSETETPLTANPDDDPFTFAVTNQPTFIPWPTRILNNVIDENNPIAYPSYYLTDDAYVTIKVYDIKGRVVKTLLYNSFRKGGSNIKEGGWRGDNKSNRKIGIGLYYMHFKASRASDGKVIIDSFKKVVVAK